jgi:hypothetical protein
VAGVAQVRDDDRFQPEAFIQLADQNQTGVRGDTRSLKRNLQKPVKRELERLGFFLTQWVSFFLAGFLIGTRRNQGVATDPMDKSTTAKSEIHVKRTSLGCSGCTNRIVAASGKLEYLGLYKTNGPP